jgi:hypothetical protein
VVDVISKGAAQSWQMENRWKTMNDGKFDFGFAVEWMRKDLRICLQEARNNGAELPVAALVDQFYADVVGMGGKALGHVEPDRAAESPREGLTRRGSHDAPDPRRSAEAPRARAHRGPHLSAARAATSAASACSAGKCSAKRSRPRAIPSKDRDVHSLHAYFLVPGTSTRRSSTRWTSRATARASATAAWSRSSMAADLQHDRVVPSARAGSRARGADAAGAGARGTSPTCASFRRDPAQGAREDAPLPHARAAVRVSARRADPGHLAAARGATVGTSGSRRSTGCQTTPICTATCLAYVSDYQLVVDGDACRTACTSPKATCSSRASITRCGFTVRFRVDDWLLYAMESPNGSGGRGLALGRLYSRDGRLVASTAQEGVIRIWSPSKP